MLGDTRHSPLPTLHVMGLGPKPFHGRVVMLVNEHTLSAGEMVADA
jgi:C-terminal processing protease CtpA/Prc